MWCRIPAAGIALGERRGGASLVLFFDPSIYPYPEISSYGGRYAADKACCGRMHELYRFHRVLALICGQLLVLLPHERGLPVVKAGFWQGQRRPGGGAANPYAATLLRFAVYLRLGAFDKRFEFACVGGKASYPFGKLLGGHGVFVEHEPEGWFIRGHVVGHGRVRYLPVGAI